MDIELAKEVLRAFGSPRFRIGSTEVVFARQTLRDIADIEGATDATLIEQWKALVFINEIVGQVSLSEMQRIALIELEFDTREGVIKDDLIEWFQAQSDSFSEDDMFQS